MVLKRKHKAQTRPEQLNLVDKVTKATEEAQKAIIPEQHQNPESLRRKTAGRHKTPRPTPLQTATQEEPKELPDIRDIGKVEILPDGRKLYKGATGSFIEMKVYGSTGKEYTIVVPYSYANGIPKVWSWDTRKIKAGELIAQGIPIAQVARDPDVGVTKYTLYMWMEHPEFKEHVDGLVTETGLASKRERISALKRVAQILFDKIVNEVSVLPTTDKSVGAILSNFQAITKQLAQEKDEFVEQTRVEQQVSGAIGVAPINIDDVLMRMDDEERKRLEEEFDKIADSVIQSLTGEKPI